MAPEQWWERQSAIMLQAAIAEMKLAPGKARGDRQQATHGMFFPLGIDQRAAQHHIAAALAIDQPALISRTAQAGAESIGMAQPLSVKLGIAARKIDRIGICRGRLIGER